MKKITKIVILALIVALLCAAAALVVNASSADVKLNVKACNLSFTGSVHIVYGVSFENVAPEKIKMLYWTETKSTEAEYTK